MIYIESSTRKPYYKLSSYIEYKARWQGIPVLKVNEAYTSQICSRCGQKGLRVRGLFTCPYCGLNLNADYNGARNILKRALDKLHAEPLSSAGAWLTQPELLAEEKPMNETREESPGFSLGECQKGNLVYGSPI
jgi:putative transposase